MRQMRLRKREIQDPQIIREILEECEVVRLGATDDEGMFIIPVNYGYEFGASPDRKGDKEQPDAFPLQSGEHDTSLTLYIHGAGEGRKAEAFAASPYVAVEMDCRHGVITGDYTCSYSYSYRSIMGNGKICRLTDSDEKRYGLTKIMEHMAPKAEIEFQPEMLERTEVFRIDVEEFTGKERKARRQSL